ncbi:MAG: hypothetical protein C4K58_08290 [Flavobacteriaceae bacterium]|nr:MAG: hypothetical protein C4K58_08290 [Flavobacteriaceae bacterium]
MNYFKKIIFCLGISLINVSCENDFVKFSPIKRSEFGYIKSKKKYKFENYRLVFVLETYKHSYKFFGEDSLYIEKELNDDKELLMNYIDKSNDSLWLKSRGFFLMK